MRRRSKAASAVNRRPCAACASLGQTSSSVWNIPNCRLSAARKHRRWGPKVRGRYAAQADHRQQGLFVVVAEAMDSHDPFQDPLRGSGDPARSCRYARKAPRLFTERQGAGAHRRRRGDMGIARHHRISRRKIPKKPIWPETRAARALARALAAEMHAGFQPLRGASADQFPPRRRTRELTPEAAARHRPHRSRLGFDAPALRPWRAVPVRSILRRRCDVRPGRQQAAHLCCRRRAADPRLYGRDHGAAGVAAMGKGRLCGGLATLPRFDEPSDGGGDRGP